MPALTSDLPSLALICCPLRMPSNAAGLRVSRGPPGLPGRLAPSLGVQLLEAGNHGAAASPGEGRVCANTRLFSHKPASPEEMTSSWAGGFTDCPYERSVSSETPPFAAVVLRAPRSPAEPEPPPVTGWVPWATLWRTLQGRGHTVPQHPGGPPALAFLLLPILPRPSHMAPRAGGCSPWSAGRGRHQAGVGADPGSVLRRPSLIASLQLPLLSLRTELHWEPAPA